MRLHYYLHLCAPYLPGFPSPHSPGWAGPVVSAPCGATLAMALEVLLSSVTIAPALASVWLIQTQDLDGTRPTTGSRHHSSLQCGQSV